MLTTWIMKEIPIVVIVAHGVNAIRFIDHALLLLLANV